MNKQQPKLTSFYVLLVLVILIGLGIIGYLQRQSINDWLVLLSYKPPKIVVQLANQDGMSAYTKRVFYVNNPQIETKSAFSIYCPNNSEQSVVLGCYHLGQNGIYILAVNNRSLYGIEQVTAAYETLHAIYQRLSTTQRSTLNSELLAFEYHGLNNPIVKAQIAGFKKTEPGGVLNEMTSLFGTEVSNLPSTLSKFYTQYFNNRQTLLNYYNDYESAFTLRQQQIASYDSQLTRLQSQISSYESQLTNQLTQLESAQANLNSQKASGQISQYNNGVVSYNLEADSYNSLATSTRSLINQYNQVVAQRNAIALEEDQLVQAITANPQPVKSVN